ncbi:MAG: NUDIX domain-containing protein [Chloroflexota bacterium]|nr:NUDIX domain-containing protein [Chloroflexota bacterium]
MSDYFARLRRCVGHDPLLHPAAAACIRDDQGRILLVRRSDGVNLWSFPGGAMEMGERADEAAVREVREETGLEVRPVALIGVYSSPDYAITYPNGDQVQPVIVFFECRVVGGRLQPDMEETLEVHYFGPDDELPSMYPCCVDKARDAFAFNGRAFFR